MKKLLLWVAKICKINLTKEVTTIKETIKYVSLDSTIDHDVTINGNLIITGDLTVTGEITCYKINNK